MTDVEQIASKLTPAQREGVMGEYLGKKWRATRCRRELVKLGLVEPSTRCLTPLGLAVRAHLEAQRSE